MPVAKSTLSLPPPCAAATLPVFSALARRRTIREIADRPLPLQTLSSLLWAACGVNRRMGEGPFGMTGRTAASASNSQEIDVYVALAEAAWRYEAGTHALVRAAEGDLRPLAVTPGQLGQVMIAPVQLIYVVDLYRLTHTQGFDEPGLHDGEVQKSYYFVDTGLIAGNVHVFAAAEGLAAWFHNCDRPALAHRLGLTAEQRVLFAQSVGYPEMAP